MKRFSGILLIILGILCLAGGGIALVFFNDPKNFSTAIAAFAVLLGVGVISIIIGFWLQHAATPKPNAIVNGRVRNYLADLPEKRFHNGIGFEVQYQTPIKGKNGRPSMLVVRLPAVTPTTVQFNPQTWFDRFGKRIGLVHQPQTGDGDFDAAIYVRGSSEEYAEAYLANSQTRAAIDVLIKSGFREVRLTGTSIEAVWMSFDPALQDRPGLTEDAAAVLSVLTAALPDLGPTFAAPPDWTQIPHVLLWIVSILFGATITFAFLYPPIHTWDLFVASVEAFAWEYPAFAAVAAILLRGTMIAHDRWGRLIGFGLLLIGAGSVGSLAAINALADPAPLVERVVPVVSHRSSSGRHGTTYYAIVNAWDRPGETVEFTVSADEYRRLIPGRSKLQLLTGPGRFGIEWLKKQTVLP